MAATDFITARQPLGTQEWTVKNTDATAFLSGHCVKLDTTNVVSATQGAPGVLRTTGITDMPFGVCIEAIPVGAYGRVQTVDGTGVWAIALGAITAGVVVGPSATAGKVTAYTATDPSLGTALTAAVNASDPVFVKINISRNA
jgi:hypothetical protein